MSDVAIASSIETAILELRHVVTRLRAIADATDNFNAETSVINARRLLAEIEILKVRLHPNGEAHRSHR